MAGKRHTTSGLVGGVLVVSLLTTGCGGAYAPAASSYGSMAAPAATATVTSLASFAELTLSDGRQVHDTALDDVVALVADSGSSGTDDRSGRACQRAALDRYAQENLVGRPVSSVVPGFAAPGVTPTAGYTPAALTFVNGAETHDDVIDEFRSAYSAAVQSCYVAPAEASPTPTTTTTEPAPEPVVADPDVDVDTHVDAPRRPRTGHSGHPCLPGERDGDGDGYCGEGR